MTARFNLGVVLVINTYDTDIKFIFVHRPSEAFTYPWLTQVFFPSWLKALITVVAKLIFDLASLNILLNDIWYPSAQTTLDIWSER